ncbi:prephenate dehydratase [Paracidovorax anthurii]|uniref:prephenate dehydratase n=1 Tax=Paracidovorax anthurii TaxID=78229 RepID=A0A328ZHU4_9BURK|nr:prephenate dehydratase domain-containing protein [Paracidovorax anthurii]RAR84763.1 prephenate dehydratase [Paracidovorax anthurii]
MALAPSSPARPAAPTDRRIAYLGPAGSWTHQACIELFGGDAPLVPMERQALFAAYQAGTLHGLCVPVATSLVGATPYLDDVLALDAPLVVAEYPRMLGYSLLALPGATLRGIRTVIAHPVALEEARPWLDRELPHAAREEAASGGAAAQAVADGASRAAASLGPGIGAAFYGLAPLAEHIEEGPHNVTRWWVLGRETPAPTGRDTTALVMAGAAHELAPLRAAFAAAGLPLRTASTCTAPGTRHCVFEVEGHAHDAPLRALLARTAGLRWLGSYPRRDVL